MNENVTIFVSEENYKKIVEKLGYIPSNLVINKFIPDTIIVNNEQFKTLIFSGTKHIKEGE